MVDKNTRSRCTACGAVLAEKDPVYRIFAGSVRGRAKFKADRQWGTLHKTCFNAAMRIPAMALELIRRSAVADERR